MLYIFSHLHSDLCKSETLNETLAGGWLGGCLFCSPLSIFLSLPLPPFPAPSSSRPFLLLLPRHSAPPTHCLHVDNGKLSLYGGLAHNYKGHHYGTDHLRLATHRRLKVTMTNANSDPCSPLFTTALPFSPLLTTAFHCSSLLTTAHLCSPLRFTVQHCSSLFTTAHHC